jgi:hypothetical protein
MGSTHAGDTAAKDDHFRHMEKISEVGKGWW